MLENPWFRSAQRVSIREICLDRSIYIQSGAWAVVFRIKHVARIERGGLVFSVNSEPGGDFMSITGSKSI